MNAITEQIGVIEQHFECYNRSNWSSIVVADCNSTLKWRKSPGVSHFQLPYSSITGGHFCSPIAVPFLCILIMQIKFETSFQSWDCNGVSTCSHRKSWSYIGTSRTATWHLLLNVPVSFEAQLHFWDENRMSYKDKINKVESIKIFQPKGHSSLPLIISINWSIFKHH